MFESRDDEKDGLISFSSDATTGPLRSFIPEQLKDPTNERADCAKSFPMEMAEPGPLLTLPPLLLALTESKVRLVMSSSASLRS